MTDQINDRLNLFCKTAKAVGQEISKQFGLFHDFIDKGNFNQQSKVDLYAEKTLVDAIKKQFPNDSIYSEEMGMKEGDQNLWILDPLDGTSNFLSGLPIFSVTATFLYNQQLSFSVFYYPVLDLLIQSVKEGGVKINDKTVTKPNTKETGVISLIGGYASQEEQEKARVSLKEEFKRILSLWCPSYDGLLLLRGRIDSIVAIKNETEDLLPTILLAQEIGYSIKTIDGKDFEFTKLTETLPSLVIARNDETSDRILAKLS